MKIKNKQGFIGTDMMIAMVSIIVFSGIIFSLMYMNALANAKLRKMALSSLYLTEIMENIAIADYETITQENIDQEVIELIPQEMNRNQYTATIEVMDLELPQEQKMENIIKKIKATITYTLQGKTYSYSMERWKVKE